MASSIKSTCRKTCTIILYRNVAKPPSERHYKAAKFDVFRAKIQTMQYYHGCAQRITLNVTCNVMVLIMTELSNFQICRHCNYVIFFLNGLWVGLKGTVQGINLEGVEVLLAAVRTSTVQSKYKVIIFIIAFLSFFRPNVCPYRDVDMQPVRKPCVRAFTRLVKVWKPNCGYNRNWCVGYERR